MPLFSGEDRRLPIHAMSPFHRPQGLTPTLYQSLNPLYTPSIKGSLAPITINQSVKVRIHHALNLFFRGVGVGALC